MRALDCSMGIYPTDLAVLNRILGKWIWLTSLPVIFVSVYPSRDIGKLQDFVKRFNADFVGLGTKDAELT